MQIVSHIYLGYSTIILGTKTINTKYQSRVKRELVALLSSSSWCLLIVVWLFLTMPRICLQFVVVAFPDHTHYF